MSFNKLVAACGAVGLAASALCVPTSPALAQSSSANSPNDRSFGERLTSALQAGDFMIALSLLEGRADVMATPEGLRLHAELLFRTGRRDQAIAELDGYLTRATDDALARFQLAEMHLAAGRLQQAGFNYRLARSGGLDPIRKAITEQRLRDIAARRGWQGQFSFALGPDSNVNSATSAATVELFGLPFALSPDGRRKASVSAAASGVLEGRLPLNPSTAALVTFTGAAQGSVDGDFTIADISAAGGIERRGASGAKIAVQPLVGVRYFNGALLDRRWGLRTAYDGPLTSNIQWSAAAEAARSDDRFSSLRDGWGYSLDVSRTRYLGPSSLWQAAASVDRRALNAAPDSYTGAAASVGRLFALPLGALAFVRGGLGYREFDTASPLFGVVRRDHDLNAAVRLSKRDWSVLGAAPFVQLSYAQTRSTVPLSDYRRNRLEVGFTRGF